MSETHTQALSPEELHLRMIRFESKCGGLAIGDGSYDLMLENGPLPSHTTQGGFVRSERQEDGAFSVTFVDSAPSLE